MGAGPGRSTKLDRDVWRVTRQVRSSGEARPVDVVGGSPVTGGRFRPRRTSRGRSRRARGTAPSCKRVVVLPEVSALSGEVTLSRAGELMGVSRASVARAAAVEKGPEPLRASARAGVVSVGDAYELRGEEPETIEQLVEDVRFGAAPNLRAAKRQRGIEDKPRKKDPRGRKPKAVATDAGQSSGEAGDGGGGVALGQLVDPEEPGPGHSGSTPDPGAGTLLSGAEGLEAGQGSVAPNPGDLRSRAEIALGGHAVVEGSSIDEGAPWPAEGGVLWVERVVDCVERV